MQVLCGDPRLERTAVVIVTTIPAGAENRANLKGVAAGVGTKIGALPPNRFPLT